MDRSKASKRIAILGGGPSGLFMYKRLVEANRQDFEIHIFERKGQLGLGMPYSEEGACDEHITNVSDNEIPQMVSSIEEWVKIAPASLLQRFNINPHNFNEYKVLPRLFFGNYLNAQFSLLQAKAEKAGISTIIHPESNVKDLIDKPGFDEVWVDVSGKGIIKFEVVIVCTGHHWPVKHEGKVSGYYDAPYPPAKLAMKLNHPVAIKGSSLTAIDAIRTLSRHNGVYEEAKDGVLSYHLARESSGFRMMMHSRSGLLPAIRFHLEDSHLMNDALLSEEDIAAHRVQNEGFLSLDFIFEKNFKEMFRDKDPAFHQYIQNMTIEEFVDAMMELRERLDPFQLFRAEYAEAEKSIKRKESVYWKEMLAVLSFAMNYPAKHLSAEDMLRLQKVLMPLISIVIAFAPQSSSRELLALHEAGVLDLVAVGAESTIEPMDEGGVTYHYTDEAGKDQAVYYQTFINCVGQPHLSFDQFPFKSLVNDGTLSPASLKFRSAKCAKEWMSSGDEKMILEANGEYRLKVPGVTINDVFQVVDSYGAFNPRIYIMAVPYIGGFNPDYSGLDFCEAASAKIIESLIKS